MPSTESFSQPGGFSAVVYNQKYTGKTWVRTANYPTVPRNELPINPYVHTTRSWQQSWNGYTRVRKSDGGLEVIYAPQPAYYIQSIREMHDLCYTAAGGDSLIDSAKNEALVRALVSAADTKANVAVALAEASKTSTMILDTATRIFRAGVALKKGNFAEVARQLHLSPKTVHKNWLAYKYGWTPLLMEVRGAAEFFAQQQLGRAVMFNASGRSSKSLTFERVVPETLVIGAPYNRDESMTIQIEVKAKLWLELTSPALSASQQVGLTNPLLVAWELVPFSFVFDWFIQVGDYLTALTALNGIELRKSMFSVVDVSQYYGYVPDVVNYDSGSYYHNYFGRSLSDSRRNYSRSTIPTSSFTLYPPAKLDFSLSRLTSGLALLRAQSDHVGKGPRFR